MTAARLFIGAVLASSLLSGCDAPPPPTLRIGLIGVFDGTARNSSGLPARDAARMAVDELNAAGGVIVGGVSHRVVLIERESANRPDAAAAAARALINLDSVDVVIGPQFSQLAVAAGAVAEEAHVPLIAPMASSPTVTEGRQYVTRLAFLDAEQGEVLARFAYDSLGIRRVGTLLNAASDYGRGVVKLFSTTFEALGGRMIPVETYNVDDVGDQREQIVRLLAGKPDGVLLPNFSVRDSSQVRMLREMGFQGRFLGSDSWDAIALRGREFIDGSIIVGNWDGRSDRDGVRAFRDKWNKRYLGDRPRATGAATYDAMFLIARAAEKARAKSGLQLSEALRRGAPYEGAFASYRFDGSGNPIRGATLMEMARDSLIFRVTLAPRR